MTTPGRCINHHPMHFVALTSRQDLTGPGNTASTPKSCQSMASTGSTLPCTKHPQGLSIALGFFLIRPAPGAVRALIARPCVEWKKLKINILQKIAWSISPGRFFASCWLTSVSIRRGSPLDIICQPWDPKETWKLIKAVAKLIREYLKFKRTVIHQAKLFSAVTPIILATISGDWRGGFYQRLLCLQPQSFTPVFRRPARKNSVRTRSVR